MALPEPEPWAAAAAADDAASAFIAACIPCGELNAPKFPNCDSEFKALIVIEAFADEPEIIII